MTDGVEPWLHESREIERGQGALADDDRMHEFDRDVLGIGGAGAATKCEQAAPDKETLGHFTACFGQLAFFLIEELLEDFIAEEQRFFDLGYSRLAAVFIGALLANAREGIADEHVDDARTTVAGVDDDGVGRFVADLADDARLVAPIGKLDSV